MFAFMGSEDEDDDLEVSAEITHAHVEDGKRMSNPLVAGLQPESCVDGTRRESCNYADAESGPILHSDDSNAGLRREYVPHINNSPTNSEDDVDGSYFTEINDRGHCISDVDDDGDSDTTSGSRSIIPNETMIRTKLKILMIGPCMSGKTTLSNFLAEATDSISNDYNPTQGVRILEFEAAGLKVGGHVTNAEVELWDCSGNHKFEPCWPALMKDTNGVMLVYNPDEANHDKELEMWYSNFVLNQGLNEKQCVIFAHHKPQTSGKRKSHIPAALKNVPLAHTSLDEESETVRTEFNQYLSQLLNNMNDKHEQEELNIIEQR